LYPSVYLSDFSPLVALKNKLTSTHGNQLTLRRTLVIVQFVISQLLIIGTIVVNSQMSFLRDKQLGFDQDAIIETDIPSRDSLKLATLRSQLLRNAAIKSVSYSNTGASSSNVWASGFVYKTKEGSIVEGEAQAKIADEYFLRTYNLKLLAGEYPRVNDNRGKAIVNESFVRAMGLHQQFADAMGKSIKFFDRDFIIAGVVGDFHSTSLKRPIEPLVVFSARGGYYTAAIKVNMENVRQSLAEIQETWSSVFPDFVFECKFLDEKIQALYAKEEKVFTLLQVFTCIAIAIGCLGLFGLISHIVALRTKEIGIRKVLGATVSSILGMFSKELGALLLAAFIFAAPSAYYLMSLWLEDFAYRSTISIWMFCVGLGISLLIAISTIGVKSLQAALANPVDSLRNE
jgi:hypothetical protein